MRRILAVPVALIVLASLVGACGSDDRVLTVYSGRSEELISPLIAQFEEQTGIDVVVRYGDSAELAATILEEGANTPADVFFAQDPASLGVVALAGLLAPMPAEALDHVPARFGATGGSWVGVSGRARVVVYDTTKVDPATLPATEDGFADPEWRGRIGIAPTNGSFLAFVAAKILLDGEEATLEWLLAMADNSVNYSKNSVIVSAVDNGEVDTGLVNHYYLFRLIAEKGEVVAANHFLGGGGAASLVMPAGIGILAGTSKENNALEFTLFMLSESSQEYFAAQTFEYPLIPGVAAHPALPPIDSLQTPELDLSRLAGVLGLATDLVTEAGLL